MIVVSDASPINYLVLIDAIAVLPALFGDLIIPQAVYQELTDTAAPEPVRRWAMAKPGWVQIGTVGTHIDSGLQILDAGEREAILLANELHADLIIIDERAARQIAARRGLRITGTLGVLNVAGTRNLVTIPEAVARLRKTSFRAAPRLYQWLLDQHSDRGY